MTDKKTEALKLALEALERQIESIQQMPIVRRERGEVVFAVPEAAWVGLTCCVNDMRQALADSALDRMAENARELGLDYEPPCKTGSQCTNKCQQCEQPAQKQEPVAWTTWRELAGAKHYGTPGWEMHANKRNIDDVPLYTSPPASKPWVGLTDEQAEIAFKAWHYKHGNNTQGIKWVDDLLRSCWKAAIEAAHGIKGQS